MRTAIYQLEAEVLSRSEFTGGQVIMSLKCPQISAEAQAGSFIHIQCDPQLPMRRPLSIMYTDPAAGAVVILFKIVGKGTRLLAQKQPGDTLNILGPIGKPFIPLKNKSRALLIGGGVGMPPMIFLALTMKNVQLNPVVLFGSEIPYPFSAKPSLILNPAGIPPDVNAAMPLLDENEIFCRLASNNQYPGVYNGMVTGLARRYLDAISTEEIRTTAVYACGPKPMLSAAHKLAAQFGIPCRVSLEEFMACGVGGCAGCTVRIKQGEKIFMRRVCVDGPVFDSYEVFYDRDSCSP